MANNDAAYGLRPIGNMSGGAFHGELTRVHWLVGTDTAVYIGSLVKLNGSSDAEGVPDVTGNISTGNAVFGVLVSMEPENAESTVYRVASTLRYGYVAADPFTLFSVQGDGTDEIGDVGAVADLVGITGGSTRFGNSTMELGSSSIAVAGDNSEDVKILGKLRVAGNDIGEFTQWVVKLLNHQLLDDVGT